MNRGKETAPLSMRECVEHLHSLHEHVVIVSLETLPVPRVPRLRTPGIDELGYKDDGTPTCGPEYGYIEEFDVPAIIRLLDDKVGSPLEVNEASYFLSKVELVAGHRPGMAAGASTSSSPPR